MTLLKTSLFSLRLFPFHSSSLISFPPILSPKRSRFSFFLCRPIQVWSSGLCQLVIVPFSCGTLSLLLWTMAASYPQTHRLVSYIRVTERAEISHLEGAMWPVLHFRHLPSLNKLFFMRQITIMSGASSCSCALLDVVGRWHSITPHPFTELERESYTLCISSIYSWRSQLRNEFSSNAISPRAVQQHVCETLILAMQCGLSVLN